MDPPAGIRHDHQGLDGVGEVVGGIAHGEELDGSPVVGPESRRHVREVGLGHPREVPGQYPHRRPPGPRDCDVLGAGKASADDHLGPGLVVELGQEERDVTRIVLTVGVDLEEDVEVVGLCHPETDPHRPSDTEGERVGDDLRAGLEGLLARVIDRAVVDDQDGGRTGMAACTSFTTNATVPSSLRAGSTTRMRGLSGSGFRSGSWFPPAPGSAPVSSPCGAGGGAASASGAVSAPGGASVRCRVESFGRAQLGPEPFELHCGQEHQGDLERGPVSRLAERQGRGEHDVESDGPQREGRDAAPPQDDRCRRGTAAKRA